MGYFISVPEQNAPSTGNTVSAEGTVTADLESIETTQASELAATMLYYPSAETVETSTTGDIEVTHWPVRECYSTETTYTEGMDIAGGLTVINESGIVSTNTNTLRFYGDTLYSGATLNKQSDATVTSEGTIVIDGGDAPTREDAVVVTGGDAENSNTVLDGGTA